MAKTIDELVAIYTNALKEIDLRLSKLPKGSTYDALAGATATCTNESQIQSSLDYAKHFIKTAEGNDLEFLATDQFGSEFARPQPINASGFVTFFLNTETNSVYIPKGTVVKTEASYTGSVLRYEVTNDGTLIPTTKTSITLPVTCTTSGQIGNTAENTINQIESQLTSSLVSCTNQAEISNGLDSLDDGAYRDYIYELLSSYGKYTAKIIEDAALSVLGPQGFASATEVQYQVKLWDGSAAVGDPFNIYRCFLFAGYVGSTIDSTTIAKIQTEIKKVKALGVYIKVEGVTPFALTFKIKVTLNSSGPNYQDFVVGNFIQVTDFMRDNILALPIVSVTNPTVTFDLSEQLEAISAKFPGDFLTITADEPTTDVAITESNQKFIPQLIEVK